MRTSRGSGGLAWTLALGSAAMAADQPPTTVEEQSFREVVIHHLQSYPAMEIQDLYKLVYQAAMGSEHAAPDRDAARDWLEQEASALTPRQGEPLITPLSPDGILVRVHLRAFLERGGDPEELLTAFVETAERFAGSAARLERYWGYLATMAEAEELAFTKEQLTAYFARRSRQGLPAVRHSAAYRDHYDPAYRVVLLELLDAQRPTITGR